MDGSKHIAGASSQSEAAALEEPSPTAKTRSRKKKGHVRASAPTERTTPESQAETGLAAARPLFSRTIDIEEQIKRLSLIPSQFWYQHIKGSLQEKESKLERLGKKIELSTGIIDKKIANAADLIRGIDIYCDVDGYHYSPGSIKDELVTIEKLCNQLLDDQFEYHRVLLSTGLLDKAFCVAHQFQNQYKKMILMGGKAKQLAELKMAASGITERDVLGDQRFNEGYFEKYWETQIYCKHIVGYWWVKNRACQEFCLRLKLEPVGDTRVIDACLLYLDENLGLLRKLFLLHIGHQKAGKVPDQDYLLKITECGQVIMDLLVSLSERCLDTDTLQLFRNTLMTQKAVLVLWLDIVDQEKLSALHYVGEVIACCVLGEYARGIDLIDGFATLHKYEQFWRLGQTMRLLANSHGLGSSDRYQDLQRGRCFVRALEAYGKRLESVPAGAVSKTLMERLNKQHQEFTQRLSKSVEAFRDIEKKVEESAQGLIKSELDEREKQILNRVKLAVSTSETHEEAFSPVEPEASGQASAQTEKAASMVDTQPEGVHPKIVTAIQYYLNNHKVLLPTDLFPVIKQELSVITGGQSDITLIDKALAYYAEIDLILDWIRVNLWSCYNYNDVIEQAKLSMVSQDKLIADLNVDKRFKKAVVIHGKLEDSMVHMLAQARSSCFAFENFCLENQALLKDMARHVLLINSEKNSLEMWISTFINHCREFSELYQLRGVLIKRTGQTGRRRSAVDDEIRMYGSKLGNRSDEILDLVNEIKALPSGLKLYFERLPAVDPSITRVTIGRNVSSKTSVVLPVVPKPTGSLKGTDKRRSNRQRPVDVSSAIEKLSVSSADFTGSTQLTDIQSVERLEIDTTCAEEFVEECAPVQESVSAIKAAGHKQGETWEYHAYSTGQSLPEGDDYSVSTRLTAIETVEGQGECVATQAHAEEVPSVEKFLTVEDIERTLKEMLNLLPKKSEFKKHDIEIPLDINAESLLKTTLTGLLIKCLIDTNNLYMGNTVIFLGGSFSRKLQGYGHRYGDIDLYATSQEVALLFTEKMTLAVNRNRQKLLGMGANMRFVSGAQGIDLPDMFSIAFFEPPPNIGVVMKVQVNILNKKRFDDQRNHILDIIPDEYLQKDDADHTIPCLSIEGEVNMLLDMVNRFCQDFLVDPSYLTPDFEIPRTIVFMDQQTMESRALGIVMRAVMTLNVVDKFEQILSGDAIPSEYSEKAVSLLESIKQADTDMEIKIAGFRYYKEYIARVDEWLSINSGEFLHGNESLLAFVRKLRDRAYFITEKREPV